MIALIHTCGAEAVVALGEGDRVVAEERLPGREASEKLVPALGRLLATGGTLEAVAVVHGPGSFTGVRVGLSAAKGLCEARAAGMLAMSRLALLAGTGEGALAVLDAGRGEFYCGFYDGGKREREVILTRDELAPLLVGRALRTCEPRVADALGVTAVPEPGAKEMLDLAASRMANDEWSDVATVDANYLRRTDAELLQELR